MIINALPNVTFAVMTMFALWLQEGWKLFGTPVFFVLLMWWLYSSVAAFALRWKEAEEKTTSEKLDAFIEEYRDDRNHQAGKENLKSSSEIQKEKKAKRNEKQEP